MLWRPIKGVLIQVIRRDTHSRHGRLGLTITLHRVDPAATALITGDFAHREHNLSTRRIAHDILEIYVILQRNVVADLFIFLPKLELIVRADSS